ncbi:13469_t:CDS:2, partial [Ambispora leptoticha]
AQTPSHPSCPICFTNIKVIREEATLASDKYQMVSKIYSLIDSKKKASQQSNDMVIDDDTELEYIRELDIIRDTSLVDQIRLPIVIEDTSNSEDQTDNITMKKNDTQTRSSGQTSPKITRDQDSETSVKTHKFQGLIQELSTSVKGVPDDNEEGEELDALDNQEKYL